MQWNLYVYIEDTNEAGQQLSPKAGERIGPFSTFEEATDDLWRLLTDQASPEYRDQVLELWHKGNGERFNVLVGVEGDGTKHFEAFELVKVPTDFVPREFGSGTKGGKPKRGSAAWKAQ
jgi:hypothetical protein